MSNIFYPAILYLEDGTLYKGWSFISNTYSSGEIVFNTGMTGYQEIMTDPSYTNQIMVFTYPELGNTGLNIQDNESQSIHIKGIIAKNICVYSSNWRSTISLKDYICKKNIPHIFGIDTRALTKHLRCHGAMDGYIFNKIKNTDSLIIDKNLQNSLNIVRKITTQKVYKFTIHSLNNRKLYKHYDNNRYTKIYHTLNIVLIDFGVKSNIIMKLLSYGCNVYIVPAVFNYNMITRYKPDGIVLSNGPGDPALVNYAVNTIKKLIKFANIPIFGICMGHQLLSLALGGSTFKLKFGHRGLNHPCGSKQYSEITSQNHGFVVNINSFKEKCMNRIIQAMYFNLNDLTLSAIRHRNQPILSVQYHPEASPGPRDASYLFKLFIDLILLR